MPPVTDKSPAVPFHVKLVPVLSLAVTVRVAVSPTFSEATLKASDTEGASVSTMYALLLLTALIVLSIYTVIAIPYSEGMRLWRGGEDIWIEIRRHRKPAAPGVPLNTFFMRGSSLS